MHPYYLGAVTLNSGLGELRVQLAHDEGGFVLDKVSLDALFLVVARDEH